jgi:hypothetical protein
MVVAVSLHLAIGVFYENLYSFSDVSEFQRGTASYALSLGNGRIILPTAASSARTDFGALHPPNFCGSSP